jgi:hypothetical protein
VFYIYGTAISDGDGRRLIEALRSTDDTTSGAAADAISKGVQGMRTAVPLTPEMLTAVRSVLERREKTTSAWTNYVRSSRARRPRRRADCRTRHDPRVAANLPLYPIGSIGLARELDRSLGGSIKRRHVSRS